VTLIWQLPEGAEVGPEVGLPDGLELGPWEGAEVPAQEAAQCAIVAATVGKALFVMTNPALLKEFPGFMVPKFETW